MSTQRQAQNEKKNPDAAVKQAQPVQQGVQFMSAPEALMRRALADPASITRAESVHLHRRFGNQFLSQLANRANAPLSGNQTDTAVSNHSATRASAQPSPKSRISSTAAAASIQRDGDENAFQLREPSLQLPASSPFSLSLGEDLHLDPGISMQMQVIERIQQQLALENLRNAILNPDLSALVPADPSPSPLVSSLTAPTTEQSSPVNEGPTEARPGTIGDILRALLGIPIFGDTLTKLRTQAQSDVSNSWEALTTGEQVATASVTGVIAGGALAAVLGNPGTRQFALGQLNGRVMPLGPLGLELNYADDQLMFGLHLDVGSLLPAELGFGHASFNAIGGPPQPEPGPWLQPKRISESISTTPEATTSIQPTLTVGPPDDKYEREADQVAKAVVAVSQSDSPTSAEPSQLQRACACGNVAGPTGQCDECRQRNSAASSDALHRDHTEQSPFDKPIQRQQQEVSDPDIVDSQVETKIQRARGTGQQLADEVRMPMEEAFGADFSNVRVHTGSESGVLNRSLSARAFTTEQDIFFGEGEYNPRSLQGKELLAHELTHVVQQNANTINREPVPNIQRGEAGVHKGDITMPGLGVDDPHFANRGENSDSLNEDERRALQVYSGNFMSDFSQANVPKLINGVSYIPSGMGKGATIGTLGAGKIIEGIIHAFAVLELGSDASQVVVAPNIEVYEAERHLDNPLGTDRTSYSVADAKGRVKGTSLSPQATGDVDKPLYECVATTDPTPAQLEEARIDDELSERQAGAQFAELANLTNEQHIGSAVPGLQFENPLLYEVSPTGLSNFLYNSVEAAKASYTHAAEYAQRGDMRMARMHVGYGDHPIQDYYSHTNFIEVALNRYINDALAEGSGRLGTLQETNVDGRENLVNTLQALGPVGSGGPYRSAAERGSMVRSSLVDAQWVSTFYDQAVDVMGPSGQMESRDAITSGTFGGKDTLVSLAHVFMPLIPKLHESTMRAVDEFAGLIEVASPEASSQTLLEELTSQSREGEAFTILLRSLGDAGIGIPVPTDISLGTFEQQVSPGWIGEPWTINLPDGTLDIEWGSGVPIMGAIDKFLWVYGKFKQLKDGLKLVANYIQLTSISNLLQAAWDRLHHEFVVSVKQGLTSIEAALIVTITNELAGKKMTAEEYANATSASLDELLEVAHHVLHDAEETTSMSDRLADGGELYELTIGADETRAALERQVGPVIGSGTREDPWTPVNPLPPSHSEISKDHPPHNPSDHEHSESSHDYQDEPGALVTEEDARQFFDLKDEEPELPNHSDGGMNEYAHGSPFFGISNALGREAMRHIYRELDNVFAELADQADTPNGVDRFLISSEAAERRNREMENDHAALADRAHEFAEAEADRATAQGFEHMQEDNTNEMMQKAPALRRVFDLVDMFVSHPDDNQWWVSVVDNYVGSHSDEVYAHILRRNSQNAARRS